MNQDKLDEIIASHGRWLRNEDGEQANLWGTNLWGADLRGVNLCKANLRDANLWRADLLRANLQGADLRGADLRDADLRGANLRGVSLCKANLRDACLQDADLRGADLRGANLRGTQLPTGIYQVVGCGSENMCTTYDSINDLVICGYWYDVEGNHLDSFVNRIESVYGPNGTSPHEQYYAEYMAAIAFFKSVKELKK